MFVFGVDAPARMYYEEALFANSKYVYALYGDVVK